MLPAAERGLRADPGAADRLLEALERTRARPRRARSWWTRRRGAALGLALSGRRAALAAPLFLHRRLASQSGGEETRAGRLGPVGGDAGPPRGARARSARWTPRSSSTPTRWTGRSALATRAGGSLRAAARDRPPRAALARRGARRRIVEFSRNRDRYMRKHHGRAAALAVRVLTAWTYALRALAALFLPGHDARRYAPHAYHSLFPGRGEGLREAAELQPGRAAAMKSHTVYRTFQTASGASSCASPRTFRRRSTSPGVEEGMVLVSAMHITAGVWVNDDEPGILEDALEWLDKLAPPTWQPPANEVARELLPDDGDYRHHRGGEDNGDAHFKNLLVHHQVVLPITDGPPRPRPLAAGLLRGVRRPPAEAAGDQGVGGVASQTELSRSDRLAAHLVRQLRLRPAPCGGPAAWPARRARRRPAPPSPRPNPPAPAPCRRPPCTSRTRCQSSPCSRVRSASEGDLLAVRRRPGMQLVERVADQVLRARAGSRRAGDLHRQAAQHQAAQQPLEQLRPGRRGRATTVLLA